MAKAGDKRMNRPFQLDQVRNDHVFLNAKQSSLSYYQNSRTAIASQKDLAEANNHDFLGAC